VAGSCDAVNKNSGSINERGFLEQLLRRTFSTNNPLDVTHNRRKCVDTVLRKNSVTAGDSGGTDTASGIQIGRVFKQTSGHNSAISGAHIISFGCRFGSPGSYYQLFISFTLRRSHVNKICKM
jgi:hypothetical protein